MIFLGAYDRTIISLIPYTSGLGGDEISLRQRQGEIRLTYREIQVILAIADVMKIEHDPALISAIKERLNGTQGNH